MKGMQENTDTTRNKTKLPIVKPHKNGRFTLLAFVVDIKSMDMENIKKTRIAPNISE